MNRIAMIVLLVAAAAVAGFFLGRADQPPAMGEAAPQSGAREILYWKAPMDPNYRRDGPGKSPMGMDLVPVYADEAGDSGPGTVNIDPAVVNNLGVRTARAERSPVARRIDTVGHVAYDENTVKHIHTRVEGWVETITVTTAGDPVERGQLLFELYSPALVNAQQEYLAALASRNTGLQKASRERLIALGITAGQIKRLENERAVERLVRFYAPSDGVVTHLGVRHGKFVTPDVDVLSIAALDTVWLQAQVLERQAGWVAAGQRAEVRFDALPGESRTGTVDYVYPELDPRTRTLRVRIAFDNPGQRLRPNMLGRITIFGEPTPPLVHVPREAVIRGRMNRVVVALGAGRFRAQPVLVGIEAGDRVVIRSGLEAGDRVVTSGQFLIDSEANIGSALLRMEPRDDGARNDGDGAPAP